MSDLPTEAHCSGCKRTLPAADFAANRSWWNGLQTHCRACSAANYAARQAAKGKVVRRRVEALDGHKRCPRCEQVKPHSEWHRHRGQAGGFAPYCKQCRVGMQRESYFRRKYGMSQAEHGAVMAQQSGRCLICRTAPAEHVDHDHETGKVRGVLCFACNAALGQFKDRPDVLRRAADYLEGNLWKPTRLAPGVYRLPS